MEKCQEKNTQLTTYYQLMYKINIHRLGEMGQYLDFVSWSADSMHLCDS